MRRKGGDRTIDQMILAARSGKQNIAEGCAASATSKEIEYNHTSLPVKKIKPNYLNDFSLV